MDKKWVFRLASPTTLSMCWGQNPPPPKHNEIVFHDFMTPILMQRAPPFLLTASRIQATALVFLLIPCLLTVA